MSYLDILPLAEIKNYLRLDDDFTDDDQAIQRMAESTFGYISKQTNHIFTPTDKVYSNDLYGNVDVYDYPINTTVFPDDLTPLYYGDRVSFCYYGLVNLNVGYLTRADVPSELIEACLIIIDAFYYAAEKKSDMSVIPQSAKDIIHTHRRFINC